jgi:hypothetical protein
MSSGRIPAVEGGIQPTIFDAKADILTATAADTPARLAVGTNGQYLQADSTTSTGLKWADVSAGGMTLISETTASALSSLSLSSIPGTYKQLVLVWSGIYHSNTSTYFDLRFNNNSGSVYGEQWHFGFNGTSNSTSQNVLNTAGVSAFGENLTTSLTDASYGARGWLTIDNYASTTKLKQYQMQIIFFDSLNQRVYRHILGLFNSTSAITSLDVVRTSGTGTFTNGTNTSIRLYGVS